MLSHLITPNFQNISGPQIQMSVLQVQSREDAVCISIVSLTGLIILKDASPLALFQEKSPFEGIFFVLGDCPLHQVIWFLISSTRHQLSLERLGAVVSTLRELFCSHKCRRSTSKNRQHSKSIVFITERNWRSSSQEEGRMWETEFNAHPLQLQRYKERGFISTVRYSLPPQPDRNYL